MRLLLALALALSLSACRETPVSVVVPREPDKSATGFFCRMSLSEHKGPRGQIILDGSDQPFWFSSIRDALTYVSDVLSGEHEIAGFWVNDMGQGSWDTPAPGTWIDARQAWYVVGSSKTAAMGGNELVPFKERDAALAFAHDFGGTLATYRDALQTDLAGADASLPDGGLR